MREPSKGKLYITNPKHTRSKGMNPRQVSYICDSPSCMAKNHSPVCGTAASAACKMLLDMETRVRQLHRMVWVHDPSLHL
ncbi:hypothetical protein I7I53_03623 [Histoplasma capsulatum var. duboisii H88]|uniref:Uncharacterized protein n=1 Tax=Ajellomyces capsulatus (strain H88) TaxID=544711 RepID=A0A8A1LRD1_AJEC8|nr:hypothetical protein I7I53_03623 [Histoplasma capsulatum var. duboisii H88]